MTDPARSDRHFGWNSARWEKKSVAGDDQDLILFFTVVNRTYSSRKITAQLDLLSKRHLHSFWASWAAHVAEELHPSGAPCGDHRSLNQSPHLMVPFLLNRKSQFSLPCFWDLCNVTACLWETARRIYSSPTAGREGHRMSFHCKKIMKGRRTYKSFLAREKLSLKWCPVFD